MRFQPFPAGVTVLLLCLASSAAAQEAPLDARALSLQEAARLAEQHNPRYRRALYDLSAAEAGARQGWMGLLPSLSLNLSTGGYLSRTFTGLDEYGKPVRRDDPLDYTGSSSSQGISLGDVALFDGGRRLAEMRASRASESAASAHARAEAAAVQGELARRYYDARRRAEMIRVEEELLASARSREEATERLLRIASASPVDLLGAQVEVARQEQALQQARGEWRKALLALAEQTGVAEPPAWELVTEAPAPFDPAALDAEALVERAVAGSGVVARAEAQSDAAAQRRRVAGAGRWPSLSAYAGASRGVGTEGYDALFDPNPLDQRVSFGVQLSIPLFQRGQASAQVAQAEAARLGARADAQAARLAVEREVRSALIDLENAWRTARLAEQARELAGRRLELANQQFRLGAVKFVELQTVIADAARAEREALGARYDFALALATLEERAGVPVVPPAPQP